LAIPQHF